MIDLTRDSAAESVPNMDSFARIGIAYQIFQDIGTFGPYVKRACEAGAEMGLHVTADGDMKAEPGSGITPDQSAANLMANISEEDASKARAVDRFLKDTDLKSRLVEFAVQALYDTGRIVRIEIVNPDAGGDADPGDDFVEDDFGDDDDDDDFFS